MYKDVSRKAYTASDLGYTYRDSDLPRFRLTKPDFDSLAAATAEKFATQLGYIGKIVVSPRPKKKHLFTLPYLDDHLLVRRSYAILKRYLGVQSFSRDAEVRQLLNIIATEPKAKILRTDIKSFFESVNLESVLLDLRRTGFNNQSTIKHLEAFAYKSSQHGAVGLPRGLSVSSLLADFSMREFDRSAKLLRSCCYYCRYVDDILVVTTDDRVDVFSELQAFLMTKGLKLNPEKTENKLVGSNNWIEFLGYSISLIDSTKVRIASTKIDKAKKRIVLALKQFLLNRNFSLLCSRIQFLSTNTIMSMYSRTKPLVVGFRYSYSLASEDEVTAQMAELDKFYHSLISSKRYNISCALSRVLTLDQRKTLNRYSFLQSFNHKITFTRNAADIAIIKQAWHHA